MRHARVGIDTENWIPVVIDFQRAMWGGCRQASNIIEGKHATEGGVGMGENRDNHAAEHPSTSGLGPLASGRVITKLPAQDLDRARTFYRDKLGLSPVKEREGGLRYLCAAGEFPLF